MTGSTTVRGGDSDHKKVREISLGSRAFMYPTRLCEGPLVDNSLLSHQNWITTCQGAVHHSCRACGGLPVTSRDSRCKTQAHHKVSRQLDTCVPGATIKKQPGTVPTLQPDLSSDQVLPSCQRPGSHIPGIVDRFMQRGDRNDQAQDEKRQQHKMFG